MDVSALGDGMGCQNTKRRASHISFLRERFHSSDHSKAMRISGICNDPSSHRQSRLVGEDRRGQEPGQLSMWEQMPEVMRCPVQNV